MVLKIIVAQIDGVELAWNFVIIIQFMTSLQFASCRVYITFALVDEH